MENIENTKKKRGRKPKIKEKTDKEPKKRGRKPKNNIIVNDDPKFENDYNEDISVILNNDKKDKNISSINAYNNNIEFKKIENNYNSNVSSICWNCSCELNKQIYSMPIKCINNLFYTYGDFCSDECCLRFAYDNYNEHMYYEVKTNINLKNIKNNNNRDINLPPSKYALKIYGGVLSNEDYIKHKNEDYNIDISNNIHINHVLTKNNNKVLNSNNLNNDLKIYRRNNDVFKNNIHKLLNTN